MPVALKRNIKKSPKIQTPVKKQERSEPLASSPAKSSVPPAVVPPKKASAPKQSIQLKPERPVLRSFECLIHAEEAENQSSMIGIFVGPNAERMRQLQKTAAESLKELCQLYKDYWKGIELK
jgi:hypothetical protein